MVVGDNGGRSDMEVLKNCGGVVSYWLFMGGGLGVAIFGRRTSAFLISC